MGIEIYRYINRYKYIDDLQIQISKRDHLVGQSTSTHPDEAPVRVQGALAALARVHTGDEEKEERHEQEAASSGNRYDAHHHGGHQQALVPAPCSTNS